MTYKLGLIGYPIKHSLSPWIHERFLQIAGLTGSYSIYEINPDLDFKEEVEHLKKETLTGFNITLPYKTTIINYLDELDDSVKKIGAVNTVVNDHGKWIGHNTDGNGYLRSLTTKYPELNDADGKRILLLGAGGAARGIFYAFMRKGYKHIDIANRTLENAKEIIEMSDGSVASDALTLKEAEKKLGQYDIIVQTTSVGMKPEEERTLISLNNISRQAIVSDIVYQPIMTQFLKIAKERGCSIHFGHTMLLYQAQLAFEIWTNSHIRLGDMDKQLQNELEG